MKAIAQHLAIWPFDHVAISPPARTPPPPTREAERAKDKLERAKDKPERATGKPEPMARSHSRLPRAYARFARPRSRLSRPRSPLRRNPPAPRPKGAQGCSHGCSAARWQAGAAQPVERVVFSNFCPGGAEEESATEAAQSNTYFSSNSTP